MGEARRPDDPLERGIEASLRRSFRPPARLSVDLGLALPSATRRAPDAAAPGVSSPPATGLLGWRPWGALAAAAAAVLLVVLVSRPVPSAGPDGRLAQVPPRAAGTPGETLREAPDLARLYARAVREAPLQSACDSPEEFQSSGAELANMLAARYGGRARLRPQAATLLQGPFVSSEWPSGTVFTGLAEGQAVVVVAEFEAQVTCCVRVQLPRESGLSLFFWRQGHVRLTEITPLSEPHLLQLFEP